MNHNNAIGCSVSECRYHCNQDDYCTLSKIEVGKDSGETKACSCSETECSSFESKM